MDWSTFTMSLMAPSHFPNTLNELWKTLRLVVCSYTLALSNMCLTNMYSSTKSTVYLIFRFNGLQNRKGQKSENIQLRMSHCWILWRITIIFFLVIITIIIAQCCLSSTWSIPHRKFGSHYPYKRLGQLQELQHYPVLLVYARFQRLSTVMHINIYLYCYQSIQANSLETQNPSMLVSFLFVHLLLTPPPPG